MDDKIMLLEKMRKKAEAALLLAAAISVGISAALFITIRSLTSSAAGIIISVIAGMLLFLLFSKTGNCNRRVKDYKDNFKAVLVAEPFENEFGEIIFHPDTGFDKEVLDRTDMIRLGNRYFSNDYIKGSYKSIPFERADVLIQQRVQTGKSSSTITLFRGRWLIFDFNKEFHFDLQIVTKDFKNPQKNSNFFTDAQERRHRIEMEDVNFNTLFHIYGQDDHEAFYILTPAMMEILKNMAETIDGEFMLGFVNHQLHVAINTDRDAMEPSIFSEIDPAAVQYDVQRETDVIKNMINSLKLDVDIFKNRGE